MGTCVRSQGACPRRVLLREATAESMLQYDQHRWTTKQLEKRIRGDAKDLLFRGPNVSLPIDPSSRLCAGGNVEMQCAGCVILILARLYLHRDREVRCHLMRFEASLTFACVA